MDINTLKIIIKDINFVLEAHNTNMEITNFVAGDDIELTIKKKVTNETNDRTETDPHH